MLDLLKKIRRYLDLHVYYNLILEHKLTFLVQNHSKGRTIIDNYYTEVLVISERFLIPLQYNYNVRYHRLSRETRGLNLIV